MCSGCSGNYADDYDDPEGTPLDEDRGAAAGQRTGGLGEASGRGASGARGEASAQPQPEGQVCKICDVRHKRHPALQPALEENRWEVLVTEDRIIEIHFLSAPVCDARPRNSPTGMERVWLNQHSLPLSANNYKTIYKSIINPISDLIGPSSIRLLYLGLGGLTAALLAAWMLLN